MFIIAYTQNRNGINESKEEAVEEACNAVKNELMGLREAARKYNVPVETLRRRTTDLVSLNCRPGPPTDEEAKLAQYCVSVADMGFGLTREGVMAIAYVKTGQGYPFTGKTTVKDRKPSIFHKRNNSW